MKKISAMIAAIAIASSASAVIVGVDFANDGGYAASFAGEYVVSLVHNGTDAAIEVGLDLLGTGDSFLSDTSGDALGTAQYTSAAGFAGSFSSQGVWESDVADSGEIVIRIIETGFGVGSVGSQWVVASANFTEYDSLVASTIYSSDVATSGFTLGTSGEAFTVIPEPATIGLLGIAGAGLYATRRKTVA